MPTATATVAAIQWTGFSNPDPEAPWTKKISLTGESTDTHQKLAPSSSQSLIDNIEQLEVALAANKGISVEQVKQELQNGNGIIDGVTMLSVVGDSSVTPGDWSSVAPGPKSKFGMQNIYVGILELDKWPAGAPKIKIGTSGHFNTIFSDGVNTYILSDTNFPYRANGGGPGTFSTVVGGDIELLADITDPDIYKDATSYTSTVSYNVKNTANLKITKSKFLIYDKTTGKYVFTMYVFK